MIWLACREPLFPGGNWLLVGYRATMSKAMSGPVAAASGVTITKGFAPPT